MKTNIKTVQYRADDLISFKTHFSSFQWIKFGVKRRTNNFVVRAIRWLSWSGFNSIALNTFRVT